MNKEEIDKFQKDYYGDTYEELSQQYCEVVELYSKSVKRKVQYKQALLDIKEMCETNIECDNAVGRRIIREINKVIGEDKK